MRSKSIPAKLEMDIDSVKYFVLKIGLKKLIANSVPLFIFAISSVQDLELSVKCDYELVLRKKTHK